MPALHWASSIFPSSSRTTAGSRCRRSALIEQPCATAASCDAAVTIHTRDPQPDLHLAQLASRPLPDRDVGSKFGEIAAAGGVVPVAQTSYPGRNRDGKAIKIAIDCAVCSRARRLDIAVENGDIVYVDRAPTF